VLPIGFTAAVLCTGGVMLGRFVDQAREFEVLSRALETKVAQRTDELARTQDALLRAEKLAALGRLAAGAAHEINNPCSVVSTNLAYLRHSLVQDSAVPQDADRCLEESIGAADRIARIIRHLVDAGRVGGTARVDMHVFAVRQAVEKAVAHARVGMTTLSELEVTGDPTIRARGDATLLHQIVVNLVINAAHAIEARGRKGRIWIEVEKRSERVVIDVRDDGIGIASEDQARVFEPFFTTKRPGLGMGLGLAVSLGLARAQGGDIVVASTSPAGTTMRVVLEGEEVSDAERAVTASVGP
jgi:C4-dicarboxylate-specific signal transduction histidine kinase